MPTDENGFEYHEYEAEKVYKFQESKGEKILSTKLVKASELTKAQKDLLLGNALYRFNELTNELKWKFIEQISKYKTSNLK